MNPPSRARVPCPARRRAVEWLTGTGTRKEPPPLQTMYTRLVSLDAYRGFIMLAMASGGLGLAAGRQESFPDSQVWQFLAYQTDHVAWIGCAFWDLIQPSFMFMVGVAMPYSYASRAAKGESRWHDARHTLCPLAAARSCWASSCRRTGGRQTELHLRQRADADRPGLRLRLPAARPGAGCAAARRWRPSWSATGCCSPSTRCRRRTSTSRQVGRAGRLAASC